MRCFIGIDLSDEIAQKIGEVQKELVSPFLRPTPLDMTHITLKFLGELSDEKVRRVKDELCKIENVRFKIAFKGVGAFPSRDYMRVIWIGCEGEGLERLADELDERLASLGIRKEKFAGHLTIARVSGKVEIGSFFEKYENMEFGEMEVSSFVFKKSTLTPKGAIHEPLMVFPLK